MTATLLYANRKLTNTLVFLMSPGGPCGRNTLLHRRFRSAISRNPFRPLGWTWLSGYKYKYNCARISRLYFAFEFRSVVIATPATWNFCAPASAFAPALKRCLLSTSDDVHILNKDTKILNIIVRPRLRVFCAPTFPRGFYRENTTCDVFRRCNRCDSLLR